jgi:NaMN:DMB phosphoribosyltransferase
VLAHRQEALVVTGAAPEAETADAELVVMGPLVTVEAPGVGTKVVTTRRFITLRTSTCRGAGALAALSW